jgi:hypothetical protein
MTPIPGGARRRRDVAAAAAADAATDTASSSAEPSEEDLMYVNLDYKVKEGNARVPFFIDGDGKTIEV